MSRKITNFKIDHDQLNKLNRYVLQEGFNSKLAEVAKLNLSITPSAVQSEVKIADTSTAQGNSVRALGSVAPCGLDAELGARFAKEVVIGGYDESKLEFASLEGTASITSHVLVEITPTEFLPASYLTLYFYTRSQQVLEHSKYVKYSLDPAAESNRDYAEDRGTLLRNHTLANSILFIDGPLIGGNLTSYTLDLIACLHEINVLPVFVVKNSDSNLVTEYLTSIKGKYNSDLHWSYQFLKPGERTNLFQYTDPANHKNTKFFSYIKPFNGTSPQRVELHPDTFALFEEHIGSVFDLIYYLMLVQGDKSNPQMRPVALAEKYAREIVKVVNTQPLFRGSSLVPTINQERFGG